MPALILHEIDFVNLEVVINNINDLNYILSAARRYTKIKRLIFRHTFLKLLLEPAK